MNPIVKQRLLSDLEKYTQITRRLATQDLRTQIASNQPSDPIKAASILRQRIEAKRNSSLVHSILDLFNKANAQNVLSVACGLCANEIILSSSNRSLTVHGLDFAHYSLKVAQSEAKHWNCRIRLCTGDIVHLPYCDEAFDVVISTAVLEHVYDIKQFHDEIYRVLRPGGICFGAAANYWAVLSPWLEQGPPGDRDSVARRLRVLPHLASKLVRGLRGEYTQNIPFDVHEYAVDHNWVKGLQHHLDPSDLHAVNPFEMARLLKLSNFTRIRVWSYYNKRSVLSRLATLIFNLPVIKIFGPGIRVMAVKPKSTASAVGVE